MPEKSSKKADGIIEKALKYVYDSVANSGAAVTVKNRNQATRDAIAAQERGDAYDKQTTDSNN